MTLELYKDAVLTRDVPEHGLKRFDIVKLEMSMLLATDRWVIQLKYSMPLVKLSP